MKKLIDRIAKKLPRPNVIFTHEGTAPYLSRYYLLRGPKSKDGQHPFDEFGRPKANIIRTDGWSLVLHKFHASDSTTKLHNHGWTWGLSFVLSGGYIEEKLVDGKVRRRTIKPFRFNFIRPHEYHRVELIEEDAWTLFLRGPRKNEWFYKDRRTFEVIPWNKHVKMEGTKTPLWIASGNKPKVKELGDFSVKYLNSFTEIIAREPKSAIEDAKTFIENATIKAKALVNELLNEGHLNFSVLADDAGLSVDLLEGKPGVYSGRYSGCGSNSKENLLKVLSEVNALSLDLMKRTAQYHCALCLIRVENGKIVGEHSSEGSRDGLIALTPNGQEGYAYDSIFLDPVSLKSYGEVSYEEKQTDSHRSRAFAQLKKQFEQ